jgi:glycosyltransferase involved in cell wall biosynthesis
MITKTAKTAILLATYNGEKYLAEQLTSIIQQTHKNWTIVASDDGSHDKTIEILGQYKIKAHKGPGKGFAANFLSLLDHAGDAYEYYAFADQDDTWNKDKLERAVTFLQTIAIDQPALYCGRTLLVDEHLNSIGHSPLFRKKPDFLNALVQNIAGGNTMVFNNAAYQLLRKTPINHKLVSHDWWAYLLISAAGGTVFYDPQPSLSYRQHGLNLVGSNMDWRARIDRIHKLFQGQLKSWININNDALLDISTLLDPKCRRQLEAFQAARHAWLIPRAFKIMRLGIYRQTFLGQLGLVLAVLCNKI